MTLTVHPAVFMVSYSEVMLWLQRCGLVYSSLTWKQHLFLPSWAWWIILQLRSVRDDELERSMAQRYRWLRRQRITSRSLSSVRTTGNSTPGTYPFRS